MDSKPSIDKKLSEENTNIEVPKTLWRPYDLNDRNPQLVKGDYYTDDDLIYLLEGNNLNLKDILSEDKKDYFLLLECVKVYLSSLLNKLYNDIRNELNNRIRIVPSRSNRLQLRLDAVNICMDAKLDSIVNNSCISFIEIYQPILEKIDSYKYISLDTPSLGKDEILNLISKDFEFLICHFIKKLVDSESGINLRPIKGIDILTDQSEYDNLNEIYKNKESLEKDLKKSLETQPLNEESFEYMEAKKFLKVFKDSIDKYIAHELDMRKIYNKAKFSCFQIISLILIQKNYLENTKIVKNKPFYRDMKSDIIDLYEKFKEKTFASMKFDIECLIRFYNTIKVNLEDENIHKIMNLLCKNIKIDIDFLIENMTKDYL